MVWLRRLAASIGTACACLVAFTVRADGPIDPTFTNGGGPYIYFDYDGSGSIRLGALALDNEGRLISAGNRDAGQSYLVARLSNHSPVGRDFDFGSSGVATNPYGTSASGATAVAIDHHDRIVTAGYVALSRSCGSSADVLTYYFSAARLKNGQGLGDGDADPTFGTGPLSGVTGVSVGDCNYTYPPRAVAVGENDEVIVGGHSYNGTVGGVALVKWTSSGVLDASFGSGGIVAVYTSADTSFGAMTLDHQGRIVTAASEVGPGAHQIFVYRFDTHGNLDGTFGTSGIVAIDAGKDSLACCIAIDPANRIVVAGTARPSTGNYAIALRLNDDGHLDSNFGVRGVSYTYIPVREAFGLALDRLGRAEIGGDSGYGVATLAHLNLDGTLNAAVGFDGVFTTPIGLGMSTTMAVLVDPMGRTIIAVQAEDRAGTVSAIVRYDELFGDGFD